MGKYGILVYSIAILLALSQIISGRPASDTDPEIKGLAQQVVDLRNQRPCYARLLEVRIDIKRYKDIRNGPHYVPECDIDGIKWRSSQCDHHEAGACFCVHEDNGEILEHTRDLKLNKEALQCGVPPPTTIYADNLTHEGHECFHMRDEFNHLQKEYGLSGHSPLPYYPECTAKGKFMAMQRNDMSQFFCVDTDTGTIIPGTVTEARAMPPKNELICQAYNKVWKDFKAWNISLNTQDNEEIVDQSSCSEGFLYSACGCRRICTSETTVESVNEDCECKPACLCPEGKYELEGKCISLEECHEANPTSNVLHSDKLNKLTRGKFSRWQQYQQEHPNALLATFNSLEQPEEEVFASGPIAYDENPNARMLLVEGSPVEENNASQGPPSEEGPVKGEPYGAEEVPIVGERLPFLMEIFRGDYNTDEVEDVMNSGTRSVVASTYEPEATSVSREDEQNGYEPEYSERHNEAEQRSEQSMEEHINEKTEPEYYATESTSAEPHYGDYYTRYEGQLSETEDNSTDGGETFNSEEDYVTEGQPDSELNQTNENEPSDGEPIEKVKELIPEEPNIFETAEVDHGGRIIIPPEEIPEEVTNEEFPQDELNAHQKPLTTVPTPNNDEAMSHSSSPPCENENPGPDANSATEPSENSDEENPLEIVNRVLSENNVIEVNLEKQSQSVRKSITG